eukprot:TRINITY_DN13969_c0_g1_i1.p1 TRINITY_DN13969_c0_g1~~TRINITY_DN13969_c0_g1_i1.p1  ORF type:complete len:164 (+),score=34.07 TRINITY_DN13969_c0_g1_i1:112-603(+)
MKVKTLAAGFEKSGENSDDDDTVVSQVSITSGGSSRVRELARERDDRERSEMNARTMEDDLNDTKKKVYMRTITKVIIPLQRSLRKNRMRKERQAVLQAESQHRTQIQDKENKERPKKVVISTPPPISEGFDSDSDDSSQRRMHVNYETDKFCCGQAVQCILQ